VAEGFRELRTLSDHSAHVLPAHSRSCAVRHGGGAHLDKDTLGEAIDHWRRIGSPAMR
jgi:hypothetical protein